TPGFSVIGSIQASGLPVPSLFTVPSRPIAGPNGTAFGSPHTSWIGIWKDPSGFAATFTVAESSSLSDTRRSFAPFGAPLDAAARFESLSGGTLASTLFEGFTRNCMIAPVVNGSADG